MTTIRRALARTFGAALLAGAVACDSFLEVENPNVIDASTIDPVQDAATLANSAQQNYAAAYGWLIMYSSWYSGETLVAETFPTRNEFGRRQVLPTNGSLNGDVWGNITLAVAGSRAVLQLALPNPTTNINIARAATWAGFSVLQMALDFCEGTIAQGTQPGPRLTTAQLLDSAVAYFTTAITVGTANATTDGLNLARAALVGRARAHLQAGRKTQAAADAAAVPAGFVFSLPYIDDLAQRNRLGNRLWQFTLDRGSISIAPAYRVNDPRVKFLPPGQHNLAPQDPSSGPFFIQQKYPAFNTPIRVASKLEADYILAETQGVTEQLALINARRLANGQPAYAGPTDANSVLTELMNQKALDFYLEGRRLGDFRRLPNNVLNLPVPGSEYFKPGFPPVSNGTCYPVPVAETDNNPNFR
jgi:starch-binding outer membrane protein, SusD/RagB family